MKAKEILELSCLVSGNSPWNYHGATFPKDLFFFWPFFTIEFPDGFLKYPQIRPRENKKQAASKGFQVEAMPPSTWGEA